MKPILYLFACASLLLGAAKPPVMPAVAAQRTDVVSVNAIDRFLRDVSGKKQSSKQSSKRRQPARPARTRGAVPPAPALAVIPVPTPKPAQETAPVAETPASQPQLAPATEAPAVPTPAPDTAPNAPVADGQPATSPQPPEATDVPKPLPKPETPPQSDTEKPDTTDAAKQKPDETNPAPADGDKASPDEKPDDAKKEEEKAETPPPPPLEKEDPEALKACLADLTALGTEFEQASPVTGEEPGCGIEQPIAVKKILPDVETGGALMRCETAKALAHWMKDNVQPAMNVAMPGRRVTGIVPGSTYACRLRNSASTGKVSEHARGNAIDVAAFRLDNGETFEMKPRDEDSTMEGAFQRTATASACLYFSTVLSPGSDATHQDHLHLDVLDRKGGYRYCR